MLTSLYFDLGGPGLTPGDPTIVGGAAWVAEGSSLIGPAKKLDGIQDDLSALWGYNNYAYEEFGFLGPNFVSTRTAHADAFTSGGKLGGPDFGLASAGDGIGDLYGALPAVSDTIHVHLQLQGEVESLWSIVDEGSYIPYVEFGSNYAFLQDTPPPGGAPVPEPITAAGMLVGAGSLLGYLRRRRGPSA
jgi:hypothetical protein